MLVCKNYQAFLSIQLLFILFPCIFAAAVHIGNGSEMICIPNATFHIDCNRCKCSPTGMSIDCTDWTCATLKIPHDLLLNLTLDCWPGEIFLLNAQHKCLCSEEGVHAICTSAHYELAHALRPRTGSIISLAESARKCTPGLVFKTECGQTCICGDEAAACLGIGRINANGRRRAAEADCNYPTDSGQRLCVPYSTFSMDCNQCICSSDGYSLSCDSYPCLGVEMRDDQILNITFLCEAGSPFLYNEHECLCSADARHALCSLARHDRSQEFRAANRRVYSIAEFRELCTPGMVFKDACNVCICGTDERAACTRIDCELGWRYGTRVYEGSSGGSSDTERIIPKMEIWTQRVKSSTRRFCKRNGGSMYCRYIRNF